MTSSAFSEFRTRFFELAEKAEHISITAHMSPDDDSIASVLAVYEVLTSTYPDKDVRILYSGPKVDRWSSFEHFGKITFVDDIANHIEGVDLLIGLDSSAGFSRFSKFPATLEEKLPNSIVIDHHASPTGNYTLSLVVPECTSNAELIYHALIEGDRPLTKSLAEALLLGIVGDTGSFSYVPPSQSQVFVLAKELLEIVGVSIGEFRSRYGGVPLELFPILQVLMKNTRFVEVEGWPPLQYAFLERTDLEQGAFTDEDMSAASHIYIGNYVPKIAGYRWGFVVTPRTDGTCRMSSRSLPGSVNVRLVHEQMGIGSGHDHAAGAGFTDLSEPADCIARVIEFMKANKPVIA